MGLTNEDRIVDVGAGTRDFGRRLHDRGFYGYYLPVDGCIDGVDLDHWVPTAGLADFYICVEVLEHLRNPFRLMRLMEDTVRKGVVVTTPNSATVDTLGIDPTHRVALWQAHFHQIGWKTELRSFFAKDEDTILAWCRK